MPRAKPVLPSNRFHPRWGVHLAYNWRAGLTRITRRLLQLVAGMEEHEIKEIEISITFIVYRCTTARAAASAFVLSRCINGRCTDSSRFTEFPA